MKYAIETLEKEADMLWQIIKEWPEGKYIDKKKKVMKKHRDLVDAITMIQHRGVITHANTKGDLIILIQYVAIELGKELNSIDAESILNDFNKLFFVRW